ncbi:hypothetical protein [Pinibacter soli]|uniref:Lin1244/Lin1753-like N-terminal domain-containing protein n=1 Tax=Pinibacter soli TaxID=3044211 RepID=A0ABT6RBN0_9BACT|nr:hypothetical protein [Pinibacter soli]MDI3319976.1 hypothetical protein [Pinibacter soli]
MPRISAMDNEKLFLSAQALLVKIGIITGWQLSDDDMYLTVITDQFTKKLAEEYGDMNTEEIEFAFRTYGTEVKDWGKQLNLSLIDEVMNKYRTKRRQVSEFEDSKTKPLDLPAPPLTDLDMEEWATMTKDAFLKGIVSIELLPVDVYVYLEEKGEIKLSKSEKQIIKNRVTKEVEFKMRTDFHFYSYLSGKDKETHIQNMCRKTVLANHFKTQHENEKKKRS